MKGKPLQFHPIADIFPLMEGEVFDDLVQDIRQNGLREPIVLHCGRILDGRNRYRACLQAGVKHKSRTYEGEDTPEALATFVTSLNLHRRQLTDTQRAMVGAKIANLHRGGDRRSESFKPASAGLKISQKRAAAMVNVKQSAVERAKAVQKHGSKEVVAAVESGHLPLATAEKIAKSTPKDKQAAAIKGHKEAPARRRHVSVRIDSVGVKNIVRLSRRAKQLIDVPAGQISILDLRKAVVPLCQAIEASLSK